MSQPFSLLRLVRNLALYGAMFGLGEVSGRIAYGRSLPTKTEVATIVVKDIADIVFFPVTIPYKFYYITKNLKNMSK